MAADPITHLRNETTEGASTSLDRTLLDLNILPERHLGRRISPIQVLPYILVLILFGLLYPSFTQLQSTQTTLRSRELELTQVQIALASYDPLITELEGLQSRVDTAQARIELIQDSYENIRFESTRWSRYLELVLLTTPEEVIVQDIDQQANQIIMNGVAQDHEVVLELQDDLEETGDFLRVSINFFARIPADSLESEQTPDSTSEDEEPLDLFGFQLTMTLPQLTSGGQP